jgi:hypothetical protein
MPTLPKPVIRRSRSRQRREKSEQGFAAARTAGYSPT